MTSTTTPAAPKLTVPQVEQLAHYGTEGHEQRNAPRNMTVTNRLTDLGLLAGVPGGFWHERRITPAGVAALVALGLAESAEERAEVEAPAVTVEAAEVAETVEAVEAVEAEARRADREREAGKVYASALTSGQRIVLKGRGEVAVSRVETWEPRKVLVTLADEQESQLVMGSWAWVRLAA